MKDEKKTKFIEGKKYASIQREINMIREAEHNNIVHIKYILNKKNRIVEWHRRKII